MERKGRKPCLDSRHVSCQGARVERLMQGGGFVREALAVNSFRCEVLWTEARARKTCPGLGPGV